MHYPEMTSQIDIDLGLPVGKKRTFSVACEAKELPLLPVLYNPNHIKKHIRLVVQEDNRLSEAMQQQKDQKLKAAAKVTQMKTK